jgi:hypothetical protein
MDLPAAQRAVSATLLWHLRVLAGWGPPLGAGPLRLLSAGFESANVVGLLARLRGQPGPAPYALGSMAVAWPVASGARTPAQLRAVLATSVWGDPGSDDLATVRLALQLGWARRVADGVPEGGDWAVSGAAIVLAKVLVADALPVLGPSARRDVDRLLGRRWSQATSIGELARSVPRAGARVLEGIESGTDLWRAETRWWSSVESAGVEMAARSRLDASQAVGVAGLLAADAWRTRAALAMAANGGGDLMEVLGAVA